MVGFERLHPHGLLPASAHLEWPFLTDEHRHLAQALHAWLARADADARPDWASGLRAAGWPSLAADVRGRAVLAEALAAHGVAATPAAQALFAPAARLGQARRIARAWRLALIGQGTGSEPRVLKRLGRLEAALDASALGVYRAAWQLDRSANDHAIDETVIRLADLMVDTLLVDLLDHLNALPVPGHEAWRHEVLAISDTSGHGAGDAAERVGRWRLQHP